MNNGTGLTDRPAPYSEEAEEATLGALMTLPIGYDTIASFLRASDFYILRHQYIYEAIERIAKRGEQWDYLTVSHELTATKRLDEVGGPVYLLRLVNNTPTSVHIEVYARIVQRSAYRRRMLAYADEVKALALNEEMAVETVSAEIEKRLLDAAPDQIHQQTFTMSQSISKVYDKLEGIMNGSRELMGVPTGFKALDTILNGARPGNLIYVAGRPGMGKSALLGCIGLFLARMGKRVFWWSGEMGDEELALRFLSMDIGISTQRLTSGDVNLDDEWPRAQKGMSKLKGLPLWFDTTPGITAPALRTKALSLQRQAGIDVVMVDYIGLMKNNGADNRVQEVGGNSMALKELARELNVPVYCAAQLNRDCEKRQDKRPMLSDLKDSGNLEQDGDVVLFLYRDEVYNAATEYPNTAEVIIAKHRAGPTATITLYFEKAITKFHDSQAHRIDLSRTDPHEVYETGD